MTDRDDPSSTMRIDIHPDFLGQSLARKREETQRAKRRLDPTTVIVRSEPAAPGTDYQKLLASIYDAVLITDSRGLVREFNSRAVDFFLCSDDELFGASVIDLISGADPSLLEAIAANLAEQRYTLIEAHCVRGDGSTFPSEIAVNLIDLGDQGQLCFFIRDISVRKRAQEALKEAVARLEEHDRSRSQFVSNVSHELRTPLTSMIYAIANMLRGVCGPIPEPVKRYLQLLEGDCKRMQGTVNDILDLRKIDNNTLTLVKGRTPFSRLVAKSAESLRVQAEQKTQKLFIQADKEVGFVDGDAHKLERVVVNVVGNAVKFTPAGGRIVVIVSRDPDREGFVMAEVRDNGIGIPEEALGKVLDRYFTVGEQVCGSGLGLAISREIVEKHDGVITVVSPPPGEESGTSVRISLPVAPPPVVLVVDDERGIRELLRQRLTAQGYDVRGAANGEEALALVEVQRPDLILLDLVLPKQQGTDVILKLKGEKSTMRIPVIAITGASVSREKAQVLQGFSIPVLAKPWQEVELLDKMEEAFLGAAVLAGEHP